MFYAALAVLGLGAFVGMIFALRQHTWFGRTVSFTWPLAIAVTVVTMVGECCNQPRYMWNAIRIAPVVAWARGSDYYYPVDQGPIQATIYLPGAFLSYWPVSMAGESPTHILLTAGTLAQFYYFLPFLVYLSVSARSGWITLPWCAMLFGLVVFLTCRNEALHYSAFHNHADAPMMCFAALATLLVARASCPHLVRQLLGSAFFLAMALFTKQVVAPLALGLGIIVWIRFGFRWALLYGMVTGILLATFVAVAVLFLDPHRALFFNTFTIPGNHPWMTGPTQFGWSLQDKLIAFFRALIFAIEHMEWLLVLAGLAVGLRTMLNKVYGEPPAASRWVWLTWIVGAACFLPVNVVANAKFGGNVNSFTGMGYFLVFAMLSIVVEGLRTLGGTSGQAWQRVALAMVLPFTINMALQAVHYRLPLTNPYDNQQEKALQLVKAQPETIYFPMYPLAMYLGDGKLYHMDEAVLERQLADRPDKRCSPTREHYRAHLPAKMEFLGLIDPKDYQTRLLEEFHQNTVESQAGPFTLLRKARPAP
jgi:hypothetical protein